MTADAVRRPARRADAVRTVAFPAQATGDDLTLHLLRRTTYGVTPELLLDVEWV